MALGTSNITAQIISDLGRAVNYEAVTVTEDGVTGDKTLTYADAVEKTWVFWKRGQKFTFDTTGMLESGDAYLMVPSSDTIVHEDRVEIDGETYEVGDVIIRKIGSTEAYKFATLFKLEGTQE